MLEIKKITKTYQTENFKQTALDEVSINFRKNEFASILGPSGSGKTTLLNIIGGLDHYDSGDLVINNISTKKYSDKDWDSYRNHRIGFVFQSYNLISHQSVLANVELALTLSGISKEERRERAKKALEDVGLIDHINKKPAQLSGGQMQRVAIARALVNDPEIILADEPTGALDSTTSENIMEILKKVSKERLVIMVTHNPELAEKYSTRIVKLKDGKIIDDSNPYKMKNLKENEEKSSKKTSMKFLTALSLSLNNLLTKKGRTILTAFAGSIGIIGIALILSLSKGVNDYIDNIQKETMLSYPISIEAESFDLSSVINKGRSLSTDKKAKHDKDAIYSDNSFIEMTNSITNSVTKNNLTEFKKYLDNEKSEIKKYIGENGIIYSYDTKFSIYSYDKDKKLVNANGSTFGQNNNDASMGTFTMDFNSNNIFTELMSKGDKISDAVLNEYDVVYGSWPKEYNEVVLVLSKNNEVPIANLYNLGLLPSKEYKDLLDKLEKEEKVSFDVQKINYEDITKHTLKLLTASDFYIKNKNGLFTSVENKDVKVEELIKDKAIDLKIVGVVKQKPSSKTETIEGSLAYTKDLTNWIIKHTNDSEIVKAQEKNKDINAINGLKFKIANNKEKASEAKKYIKTLDVSEKAEISLSMLKSIYGDDSQISDQVMYMSESDLALLLDNYIENPDDNVLISIYDNYISTGTYDDNMKFFGKVSLDTPSKIDIYTDNFENKDKVKDVIASYNKTASKDDQINYTDYVGLLMSSVTTIVNAISYVLIAFVSISLIVSSIMIAIITYISVLERTKEIGILRAIGASKKDVSRVFKAETFIEGFIAGLLGIVVTVLLNIPINGIIKGVADVNIKAALPLNGAIILIIISAILTIIAGLIPSKMAAKKDPVESLRSE